MKAVLLVDDEYYIRIRVRKCIDWEALGFDTVVDCESAGEALELLNQRRFDLIVFDISMPIMDGLVMCQEIHKRGHQLQFIVLSGYDRFEYAKTALGFDVLAYILKPVDSEELEQAVRKAVDRIDKKLVIDTQSEEHAALKLQSQKLQDNLFFSTIFTDSYLERGDTAEQLRVYQIVPEKKYSVLYCQPKDAAGKITPPSQKWPCLVEVFLPQGFFAIILAEDREVLASVQEYAAQFLDIMRVGLSPAHDGTPQALQIAYKEVRLIVCQQLLDAVTAVFCYDDYAAHRKICEVNKLRDCRALLNHGLQEHDVEKVREALDRAFATLANNHNSVFGLHLFLERLLFDIQHGTLSMSNEWMEDTLLKMQAFEMMSESFALAQIKKKILEIAEKSMEQRSYFATNAGSMLVNKIESMVRSNYMDPALGLSSIAQAMSLNASYLSDAFKRIKGQSLIQYITETRMTEARSLLNAGDLSLVQVMERVGYNDPYYFSKRFKKFFGVSPSSCRAN